MSSRIFVIKLKDIIKTALLALVGIIIIVGVIAFFGGEGKGKYKEGTYYSQIILQGKPVELCVSVDRNEILSVSLDNLNETQEVFYPAFSECIEDIASQVVAMQSTDIELEKNYEVTGSILLDAVESALKQAER